DRRDDEAPRRDDRGASGDRHRPRRAGGARQPAEHAAGRAAAHRAETAKGFAELLAKVARLAAEASRTSGSDSKALKRRRRATAGRPEPERGRGGDGSCATSRGQLGELVSQRVEDVAHSRERADSAPKAPDIEVLQVFGGEALHRTGDGSKARAA